MSAVSKISVYSLPDLKNTTDDALPNYLNSLGFTQSHFYTDVRLALGYSAVVIAGALFYADWKLGWDVTKPYTLPAVLAYMVLNGAFTYWLWWVEGSTIYVGERKGVKLVLSSSSDKSSASYNVKVKYTTSSKTATTQQQQWKEIELKSPFAKWFSSDGYFVARPFQHFLASNIPIVGEADPKNTVEYVEAPRPPPQNTTPGAKLQNTNVNIDNMGEILAALDTKGNVRKRG